MRKASLLRMVAVLMFIVGTAVNINAAEKEKAYKADNKAVWTYMLYLYEDGTDLDGNKDFNEWEMLGSIEGKVNYIVLYDCDDDTKDGIYYVKKDPNGMNTKIVSKRISSHMNAGLDMNNAETLKKFILWAKEKYPADHYGCNVWDHGSGIFKRRANQWKSACGEMKVWDLASALKAFKDVDGQGFDIFGFDVCLLGQVETVYDIKDYTKIVIASERTEPGDGWDYNTQFKMLNDNPNIDIYEFAKNIVVEFDASYDNGSQGSVSTTQTAVRTDKFISEFVPALNSFSDVIYPEFYGIQKQIKEARNESWYSDGFEFIEHRDLGGFLTILKGKKDIPANVTTTIDNLLTAYNNCIIETRENGHAGQATGLKIWIPDNIATNSKKDFYLKADSYLKISETKWDEFLTMYGDPFAIGIPQPRIKAHTDLTVYVNNTVKLQDISKALPTVTGREWNITPNTYNFVSGDKNSEILELNFTQAGSYNITLKVINADGTGTVTKNNMITVKEEVVIAPKELYAKLGDDKQTVTLNWKSGTIYNGEKFIENFEGNWPPSGWEINSSATLTGEQKTAAADAKKWFHCDQNSFKTPKLIHNGTYSAAIGYQAKDFNWLITPTIKIEKDENLKFWVWYGQDEENSTNFRVMIYADGLWKQELFYTKGSAINVYDKEVFVNLSDYQDKDIKIAFVYEYTDGYQLAIDDVYIGKGENPGATNSKRDNVNSTVSRQVGVPANRVNFQSYTLYRNNEKIADNITNLTFTDKLPEKGVYNYTVTSVYSNPSSESEKSNQVTINTYEAPNKLTVNLNTESRKVVLAWEKPTGNEAVVSYNIYKNNSKLTNTTMLTYEDQLSDDAGAYEYYVTAVYDKGESPKSNKETVNIGRKLTTAIGDDVKVIISAYPNPNNGTFTLNVSNYKNANWQLLDIGGRLIKGGIIDSNNTTINVEYNGIYMVKVTTNNSTNFVKIIVK